MYREYQWETDDEDNSWHAVSVVNCTS